MIRGLSQISVALYVHIIIASIIILIGLQLFLFIQGVILDAETKKLKRYYFIFFRFGNWIDISAYDGFSIERFESTETRGVVTAFATVSTKYYDLFLTQTGHAEKILLKSCSSIEYAEELKIEVCEYLHLSIICK